MERYLLLQGQEADAYAHMVPAWLLEEWRTEEGVQLWGMADAGSPCGAAVLRNEEGVITLHYLYVAREYRGEGKGAAFLAELLFRAYHSGALVFQVRYIPGEYPKLERLLTGYPFQKEEEMLGIFTCTLGELAGNKYLQGAYGNVKALSQCTEESLRAFYQEIVTKEENLVEMPVKREDYLADCCAVAMEKGKPAGLLLVREGTDGGMEIPFLLNLSANVAAPVEMIRFAVQTGSKKYAPETVCRFAVISEGLMQILEKMGLTGVKKRQRCILRLSYFAQYERAAQRYIDGETDRV